MEPLQWMFVLMAITLIFIVFAFNPLQEATEDAIAESARLQTRRIASVINLISTAPDGTTYILGLPNTKCTVKITDNLVAMKITLTGKEVYETTGIIKTVPITSEDFDCKTTPKIKLTKNNGALRITRG